MDVNQPSRLRAVSQLKLLLALNATIDPQLRDGIDRRLDAVSSNPLDNDYEAETQLARRQYAALVDYARRPEGLPARLELDRRAEAMPLMHGRAGHFFPRRQCFEFQSLHAPGKALRRSMQD
jgi:hypothetical protein